MSTPGATIRITDVAPRDGLQNEPRPIPTADKLRLVEALCAAQPDEIEVSSFVSPRWIPQLGDAAELFTALAGRKPPNICFSALVPNEKGMHAALAVNDQAGHRLIDKIAVFTAASETFARRNTNATIAETIDRFRPVIALAHSAGLKTRGYISCAVACPFEGPIAPAAVARVAKMLIEIGLDEIDVADTIGAATPDTLRPAVESAMATLGPDAAARLTLHLHDTFGRAADCVLTALDLGIRSFDGAAGGLGGCPYASTPGRRAPGNIATELLIATVRQAGFSTAVNLEALASAGHLARALVPDTAPGSAPL